MQINFEGISRNFNDVVFDWYVKGVNNYRLSISFIGAIDEDENEDLHNAIYADIDIIETGHHDPDILKEIQEQLKDDIEFQTYSDAVMISAPEIRDILTARNEASYEDTIEDFNKILGTLTAVLVKHESKDIEL